MKSDDQAASSSFSHARIAELLLDHARDYAIFLIDRKGRIASWSRGAERITGYTADEAVGMDFSAIFTSSDRSAHQDQRELEKAWRDGRAEDSRWHVRKNGERFWANGVTTALRDARPPGLIKIIRDETRSRLADEQRLLLLNELNHRINNTLVTVQSLMEQTLRAAEVEPAVRDNLAARLMALSEAHRLLVEQNWAGADVQSLVDNALAPYELAATPRLTTDGPSVLLSPRQAVPLALVLHELTTNAVKYGSLSSPDGCVDVSWNLHLDEVGGRHMTFLWAERGGPPVTAPERKGFGSRLIARSFGQDTGGQARMEFAPEGVRCTIDLPLSTGAEIPGE